MLAVRPAHADTAPWEALPLPVGVAEVREALGIRSASPASDLILEVARKHFYLPGRGDALNSRLSGPIGDPATGLRAFAGLVLAVTGLR